MFDCHGGYMCLSKLLEYIHLGGVNFAVCKLYLNKAEFNNIPYDCCINSGRVSVSGKSILGDVCKYSDETHGGFY
jgi:hypothetical protein